ncbi:C2 domain [Arabidopsis suecica]|uniref:C2 domain n=1 Tax=Arabidopsis suecica TaxID=45249 RepID=A0A8T1YNH8_ARASU|nr:C2 domain [Arabidopsis suecica]
MSPPREKKNPTLEVKIISANDVSLINVVDKMDIYAVVSITGHNNQKRQGAKTPIDFYGGSNPTWNHTMKFSVNEEEALLTLKVKLFSYWLEGENDLYLGEVHVSVQELLASNPLPPLTNGNEYNFELVTYPLKIMERTKGTLSFSYRLYTAVPVEDMSPSAPDYSLSYGQPVYPNPDPASSGQSVMCSPLIQTTVTKLTLELMIKSAKDISKVNIGNEMSVYASVMILEGKKTTTTNTPITYCAYRNPRWDHEIKFDLDEKLVRDGCLTLVVKLIGVRTILEDKDIGVVKVPIKELFGSNQSSLLSTNSGDDNNGISLVTRGVRVTGSSKEKGTLSFTYRFLAEQAPQQFIVNPGHATLGYPIVQPEANVGTRNGQLPVYMQSQYNQSHGYQDYSPPQMQSQPQNWPSQLQPLHPPLLHTQSQSQSQQYSPPQPQQEQHPKL